MSVSIHTTQLNSTQLNSIKFVSLHPTMDKAETESMESILCRTHKRLSEKATLFASHGFCCLSRFCSRCCACWQQPAQRERERHTMNFAVKKSASRAASKKHELDTHRHNDRKVILGGDRFKHHRSSREMTNWRCRQEKQPRCSCGCVCAGCVVARKEGERMAISLRESFCCCCAAFRIPI